MERDLLLLLRCCFPLPPPSAPQVTPAALVLEPCVRPPVAAANGGGSTAVPDAFHTRSGGVDGERAGAAQRRHSGKLRASTHAVERGVLANLSCGLDLTMGHLKYLPYSRPFRRYLRRWSAMHAIQVWLTVCSASQSRPKANLKHGNVQYLCTLTYTPTPDNQSRPSASFSLPLRCGHPGAPRHGLPLHPEGLLGPGADVGPLPAHQLRLEPGRRGPRLSPGGSWGCWGCSCWCLGAGHGGENPFPVSRIRLGVAAGVFNMPLFL